MSCTSTKSTLPYLLERLDSEEKATTCRRHCYYSQRVYRRPEAVTPAADQE